MMIDVGRPIRDVGPAMLAKAVAVGRAFPPYDTMMRVTVGTQEEMAKFRTALGEGSRRLNWPLSTGHWPLACYPKSSMKACYLLLLPALLAAQSLKDFEKKVTEFTLPNGLRFLIIERHGAPVVSFNTYVNAGSVDDPSGQTGIAHMFEHMAFKGTPQIGSKNWVKEKAALDAIEVAYDKLEAERRKGKRANPQRVKELEAALKDSIATADEFVEPSEYERVVEQNGGVGLNAGTGHGLD
jgi:hypothetical protein